MLNNIYRCLFLGLLFVTWLAIPSKAKEKHATPVLVAKQLDTIPAPEEDPYLKQMMEEQERETEKKIREEEDRILNEIKAEIAQKKKLKAKSFRRSATANITATHEEILAKEYHALMKFYEATNGNGCAEAGCYPNGWLLKEGWKDADPNVVQPVTDDWTGITVDENGYVVGLSFTDNRLYGHIPDELSDLEHLKSLTLSSIYTSSYQNIITGSIPESLGQLTNLITLSIKDNSLTGNIPESLGQLSNLTTLYIHASLTGSIPNSLSQLSNLTYLRLDISSLTGTIPESLGQLRNLTYLYILGNSLTGSIPESLGQLSNLTYLWVAGISLTGSIPESLGQLSNLTYLTCGGRSLTGSIPESLGQLSKLVYFRIGSGSLTGNIPESLGQLSNLTTLYIQGTSLTGTIPKSLGQLKILKDLAITNSYLTGNISESIGQLSSLQNIYLHNNQFTFSSLLSTIQNFQGQTLIYRPQRKVGKERTIRKSLGSPVTISTTIDTNTEPASVYTWYKNNALLQNQEGITINGPNITISSMSEANVGTYTYKITNTAAPALTLESNPITLQICEQDCDTGIPQTEYLALLDLYNQAGGQRWTHQDGWAMADPEGDRDVSGWYGVTVVDGHVTGINLAGNNLTGTLPGSFSNLNTLDQLALENNNLTFSDLLPVVENFQGTNITYHPQGKVGREENIKKKAGSQVIITTNVDHNTSTSSQYQWYKNGVLLQNQEGITIDGPTLTITSMSEAHKGVYTYTITNPAAPDLTLESNPITLELCDINCGPSLAISATQTECGVAFSSEVENQNNCDIISYEWNLGDGQLSAEANPFHKYEQQGTYEVTLKKGYRCGGEFVVTAKTTVTVDGTTTDPFANILINVPTQKLSEVLSASAATFSDAWPLEHPSEALATKHSFLNGSQGVWRTHQSYVYDKDRDASTTVNTAKDGTFDIDKFNWDYAGLEAIPNWLPANAITEYSPYSYELENRDVLGRYSAALYNFDGQLPQAVGQNMQHKEMAFSSFEFKKNIAGNLVAYTDGNWRLGKESEPVYKRYQVQMGNGRMVVVKGKLTEFENKSSADVIARGMVPAFFVFSKSRFVQDNPIVCRYTYQENPDWSVLVFERPIVDGLWLGDIMLRNEHSQNITLNFDESRSHSGRYSLKVSQNIGVPQDLLSLTAGKEYLLSAWVSVGSTPATPTLGEGIGIQLTGTDKNNNTKITADFAPSGTIIEGWQKLEGRMVIPEDGLTLKITFKKGAAASAWFDDLRLHPAEGNMQSYVYELDTYRLNAELDENLYATFYYYDQEGKLYLVKKETERGIKTLQESVNYQRVGN